MRAEEVVYPRNVTARCETLSLAKTCWRVMQLNADRPDVEVRPERWKKQLNFTQNHSTCK